MRAAVKYNVACHMRTSHCLQMIYKPTYFGSAIYLALFHALSSSSSLFASTAVKRSWVVLGFNLECDTKAGEVYLQQSPGKVSSLERCKKSCQDSASCRSITFYGSGWCSHYSTQCNKVKTKNKAVALQLAVDGETTTTPQSTTGRCAL